MKLYEIKSLSSEELKNRLNEESESLENLRFQKSMGQLENFKSIMNTKKLIARIHTVLKERASAGTVASSNNASADNKEEEETTGKRVNN